MPTRRVSEYCGSSVLAYTSDCCKSPWNPAAAERYAPNFPSRPARANAISIR